MRAVVQRVSEARVEVDGRTVAEIGRGLLVLLGVESGDSAEDALYISRKIAFLRIFPSPDGMKESDRSVKDTGGSVLIVPQFTLLGDVRKGNRPSFTRSEEPGKAREVVEFVARKVEEEGIPVSVGAFQEHMHVHLVNDGPYTVLLDSKKTF
ncbi:MAG: D-tyrosyl-tRNA(Tyr) deacylase [Deltaproteobacteria bacterium]|nr:MAG: D-tyrosyl-tRNA(Tyr) deacylase [Deltaproteobacteria bacterium]